jgi:hypothetical protein
VHVGRNARLVHPRDAETQVRLRLAVEQSVHAGLARIRCERTQGGVERAAEGALPHEAGRFAAAAADDVTERVVRVAADLAAPQALAR